MTSVRKAMGMSLAERYVSIGLTLVSFVVIARLLTPTEIGLFSIASALVGLAHVIRDFGVGSYLVQEIELTRQRVNTAFTMTAGLGAMLFIASFAAAPWIAAFYAEPRLVDLLRVLAINFLLIPIGSVSLALLHRELRFGALFIVNITAVVVGFGVTMALALSGHSYMSLAWGAVAGTATTAATAWCLRPSGTSLRPGLRDWQRVLRYGGQLTAAGMVTELSLNISDLVIGRVMGPMAVALASRAQGLMNMMNRDFLGAVSGVMFAAFARTRREGGDLEASYQRSVAFISVLVWPFYGFVALFPQETLRLLLGRQWDAAAPLVPIFCLAGAVAVFWKMVPALLQATGRADLLMRADFIIHPSCIAIVVATVTTFRSLEAFAYAILSVYVFMVPVFNAARRQVLGAASPLWSAPLSKSLVAAAAALVPATLLAIAAQAGWYAEQPQLVFWAAVGATCACWPVAVLAVRHPLADDPVFVRARQALGAGKA